MWLCIWSLFPHSLFNSHPFAKLKTSTDAASFIMIIVNRVLRCSLFGRALRKNVLSSLLKMFIRIVCMLTFYRYQHFSWITSHWGNYRNSTALHHFTCNLSFDWTMMVERTYRGIERERNLYVNTSKCCWKLISAENVMCSSWRTKCRGSYLSKGAKGRRSNEKGSYYVCTTEWIRVREGEKEARGQHEEEA